MFSSSDLFVASLILSSLIETSGDARLDRDERRLRLKQRLFSCRSRCLKHRLDDAARSWRRRKTRRRHETYVSRTLLLRRVELIADREVVKLVEAAGVEP